MSVMSGLKIHVSARNAGVGMLALLLTLTACTPSTPPPGGTSQPATSPASSSAAPATTAAPSATTPAPSATTPAPSTSATAPADSGGTAPPQAGDRVISSRIALDWTWPGPGSPFKGTPQNSVPVSPPPAAPLSTLYQIGAGKHPADTPPYDQLSFRFEGGFPGYEIEFVPELIADASGQTIPMPGTGAILRVVFRGAQAHTADGTASTITSAPAPAIGYQALTSYVPAGDFEGYVSYGIGVGRPMGTVPQTKVRVYEVEKIEAGRHLSVIAIQLDTTPWT